MTPQDAAKGMRVRYRHGKVIYTVCNLRSGKRYGSALLVTDTGRYVVERLSRLVPAG